MGRSVLGLRRSLAARLLPALIGIMIFIGLLALAAALAVDRAVESWSRNIDLGLTATLPDTAGAKVDAVVGMLRTTPGVAAARRVPQSEVATLLAPWLGSAAAAADLPLPVLIDIRLDPAIAIDQGALGAKIARMAEGARLDSHRDWIDQAVRLGRSLQAVAFLAVCLIAAAVAAVVIVSVRAGLAVEHDTIELLHLIGAQDGFIAAEFQEVVTRFAGIGGVIGTALALGAIMLLADLFGAAGATPLPKLGLGLQGWLALAGFVLAAILLARWVARLTVMLALRRMV
ncbi:cell division protein FtsX [Desertibaculum subflavum]|uniref:cell division protein FtsX n=1 Tax=Desertibaculum subflavum TaxID=2268458 RepID=UPI0013C513F5